MKTIVLVLLPLLLLAKMEDYQKMLLGSLRGAHLTEPGDKEHCHLPHEHTSRRLMTAKDDLRLGINFMLAYARNCEMKKAVEQLSAVLKNEELFDLAAMSLDQMIGLEDQMGLITEAFTDGKADAYETGIKLGGIVAEFLTFYSPYILHMPPYESPPFPDVPTPGPRPLAIFHGIGDCCCFPGMKQITKYMKDHLGVYTQCVEIGDGPVTSWFTSMNDQVKMACDSLKKDPIFSSGQISVMGLSQGGLVARGIVEQCDVEAVKMVTMGGPHMGVSAFPNCEVGIFCDIVNRIIDMGTYWELFQDRIAPAEYFRDPFTYERYVDHSIFLPYLNNQRAEKNETYKQRFSSLEDTLLIMFGNDTVVDPKESEQFGYYENNSKTLVQTMTETTFFKEDWIGLKTLYDQGKVKTETFPGEHLTITYQEIDEYVLPFLKN